MRFQRLRGTRRREGRTRSFSFGIRERKNEEECSLFSSLLLWKRTGRKRRRKKRRGNILTVQQPKLNPLLSAVGSHWKRRREARLEIPADIFDSLDFRAGGALRDAHYDSAVTQKKVFRLVVARCKAECEQPIFIAPYYSSPPGWEIEDDQNCCR